MENMAWQTYEEVAAYLLDLFKNEFGLDEIEGKQKIKGKACTEWEIDAKGVINDGEGFIVVECKRLTTSKVPQDVLGSLAYTIKDLGADGGIIVTPNDIQKGAKKIAEHEEIIQVTLTPNSTPKDFDIGFFGKFKGGRRLSATICGVKSNAEKDNV